VLRPNQLAALAVALFSFGAIVLSPNGAQGAPKAKPPVRKHFVQSGMASWYSMGTRTASGERYNPDGLSAAHRTLPFGTRLLVSHKRTRKSVLVTVNDRGPFIGGRIIDLSRGAARRLGIVTTGVAPVTIEAVTELASAK
jgi:rare lipoprotein A